MSLLQNLNHRGVLLKVFGCATFTLLSFTGIIGNALVIYAIFKDPTIQTRNQLSNLAILNLAYTDLMTTSIVCFPAAVTFLFDEYSLGPVFCKVWSVCNLMGIVATLELLMVISVERFIAVCWPLHYPQRVTYPRVLGACLFVWASTLVCSLGWALFPTDYDYWAGVCDFTWQHFGPGVPTAFWYGFACTIWFFLIPSSTILICNVAIIRISKRKGRVGNLEDFSSPDGILFQKRNSSKLFLVGEGRWGIARKQNETRKNRIPSIGSKLNSRILKSMTLITVSYFVLTFPVGLIRVVKVLSGPGAPGKYIPGWVTLLCSFLQFSASIVNPLIYGLFRKDFRNSYARVFRRGMERFRKINE